MNTYELYQVIAQAFSPSAPVNERDLFAGRTEQVRDLLTAVEQRGQHAVVFGERGVGKTSLANIAATVFAPFAITVKVNCDGSDTFSSLWGKVRQSIVVQRQVPVPGFGQRVSIENMPMPIPDNPTPEDIRHVFSVLPKPAVIFIDEADRIQDSDTMRLLADTIKTLSDNSVATTIVVVGVADSVDVLISQHLSIERALVQIRMPRMSSEEVREILDKGMALINQRAPDYPLTMEANAADRIVLLSEGLPHYTHLLSLFACQSAVDRSGHSVDLADIDAAVQKAIDKAQQTILTAYHRATSSPRKDNLYRQALLSCALAETDDLGYFAAADVRTPMSLIMGKKYEIPAFSRHLNEFCEASRGSILQRIGSKRRFRFRFQNPLMQPFIVMHGLAHGIVTERTVERLRVKRKP